MSLDFSAPEWPSQSCREPGDPMAPGRAPQDLLPWPHRAPGLVAGRRGLFVQHPHPPSHSLECPHSSGPQRCVLDSNKMGHRRPRALGMSQECQRGSSPQAPGGGTATPSFSGPLGNLELLWPRQQQSRRLTTHSSPQGPLGRSEGRGAGTVGVTWMSTLRETARPSQRPQPQ